MMWVSHSERIGESIYNMYRFIANLSILFDRITNNWGELNNDTILYFNLMNKSKKKDLQEFFPFFYIYTYKIFF